MPMPFLVRAMVRQSYEEPYRIMHFIDESPDVQEHMRQLIEQGYQVCSVESQLATEMDMTKYSPRQGNMPIVDNVPAIGDVVLDRDGNMIADVVPSPVAPIEENNNDDTA